jgi:hypothetical protein
MDSKLHIDWKLRAGGVISVLYLVFFGMCEAYSAAATAFDRHLAFPMWEPYLGWALFVLPCILIAGLFLLHGRGPRFGFILALVSLCLYASFIIFDSVTSRGHPVSQQAVWEVTGIYVVLFLVALVAAYVLKAKNVAIRS